jgi:hypothetical protein
MRYPGGLIATTPVNQQFPSGVWTGVQSTPYQTNNVWGNDTSFKNTTMLLHGDGATTPFIKDASTNNFQLTIAGDTKPNNLTPFITNGYWSNYFTDVNAYLGTPTITLGTSFTIEFFVNFPAAPSSNNIILGNPASGGGTFWVGINTTVLVFSYGGTNRSFSFTPVAGTWYYVQIINTASTVSAYVNGSQIGTTQTGSTSFSIDRIAGYPTVGLSGYLSNLRVTNAANSVSATPTSPLTAITNCVLLTCQSNRFVDNSASSYTLTPAGSLLVSMQQPFTAPSGTSLYGSGYFDGTGDYLSAPANSTQFSPGTSNLTVEGWFYFTNLSAGVTNLFGSNNGSGSTQKMTAYIEANGTIHFDLTQAGGASQATSASGAVVNNAWYHLAFVRNSSTATIYVNGTSVASGSATGNLSALINPFYIGYIGEAYGVVMSGYISNFRYVNGTAIYTAAFTPPTAPLTAVTNTSLLTLQTNGPANNSGFLDSSYNSFPITRNGNTTQGSFTPYRPNGYWSNNFVSGAYLTFPDSTAFNLSGGTYTIECWVNPTGNHSNYNTILAKRSGDSSGTFGWELFLFTGTGVVSYATNYGTAVSTGVTLTANVWSHIAVVYDGTNASIYINGTRYVVGATANTNVSSSVYVGTYPTYSEQFLGSISNMRITKGGTLYTGTSFTVPTQPLTTTVSSGTVSLLTCQSNRFLDTSVNAVIPTITGSMSVQVPQLFSPTVQYTPSTMGGSAYFDGNDYLSVAYNSAFAFPGNFTVEFWVNFSAHGNYAGMVACCQSASITGWQVIFNSSSNNILVEYTGGSFISSAVVPPNQWNHIALVRSGSSIVLYLNGVSVGTATSSATFDSGSSSLLIGVERTPSFYTTGYISNVRIVKGTAVYTAAFTPPTSPLTAITNTQFLGNFDNAAIFDNSGMNNLETVGNAQIDTSVVKYGTSSMYFDGSGDYLYQPSTPNLTFGSGDFTVEMWVNPVALSGTISFLIGMRPATTNGAYPVLYATTSGTFWYVSSADRISGAVLSTNIWTHVAVCRSGTSTKMFFNGVQTGSTYSDSTSYLMSRLYIGASDYNSGSSEYLNGYIDDLRITKGVARYVGNFTPPVARMPNQ